MSDMSLPDGRPHIMFVGDLLDARFGRDATPVICPFTDPFVRHHGALDGFVRVHLAAHGPSREDVVQFLRSVQGIHLALDGNDACARFELPAATEGDVSVLGDRDVALGAQESWITTLAQLAGERPCPNGGEFERTVPFLLSRSVDPGRLRMHPRLRNYGILDAAPNGFAG